MIPLGVVLASGTVGLLLGFALPALGTAAAAGLVLNFVCALGVARVHDRQIAGAVMFLALIVVALAADSAYRNDW